MENVLNTKYATWLEDLIQTIVENKPEKIGVVFTTPDNMTYTYYFGDCDPPDKALMAYWINSDATMDTVLANSKMIMDAEDYEDEYDEYHDDD